MGFFDALKEGAKKFTNCVTGGYGEIEFSLGKTDVSPGERVPYKIKVDAKGELKAKRILLILRALETCELDIEVDEVDEDKVSHGNTRTERKTFTNYSIEENIEVHGELEMNEGESETYSGEVTIPEAAQPTYFGPLARHEWSIEADVDIPWGKDLKKIIKINVR
ncbi:MAG: hypothetical protein K8T10_07505 [Candidatus Eremiobacteraeota bacterium]|nr:hypothetical protein [Candidatus Eremiobacteraeota bacterium]